MEDLIRKLEKKFIPILAIVVYKSGSDYSDEFYLESHEINEQGQILCGKPLLQETLHDIVDVMFDERKDSSQLAGEIPTNLLSYSPSTGGKYNLVWYRPAEIRFIHFAKELKIPSGKCWVPATIYKVEKEDLSVFALQKDTRPEPDSKLYRAPYHNVGDEGIVCLGSATIRRPSDKSFVSAMKYWEDLFWNSKFTHLNGDMLLDEVESKTKTPLKKVWEKLMASGTKKKWSEVGELVPMGKKLKAIL